MSDKKKIFHLSLEDLTGIPFYEGPTTSTLSGRLLQTLPTVLTALNDRLNVLNDRADLIQQSIRDTDATVKRQYDSLCSRLLYLENTLMKGD